MGWHPRHSCMIVWLGLFTVSIPQRPGPQALVQTWQCSALPCGSSRLGQWHTDPSSDRGSGLPTGPFCPPARTVHTVGGRSAVTLHGVAIGSCVPAPRPAERLAGWLVLPVHELCPMLVGPLLAVCLGRGQQHPRWLSCMRCAACWWASCQRHARNCFGP